MPNGADYLTRYAYLTQNASVLRQRVTLAAIDVATDVSVETGVTNHADRVKLAGAVLKNPEGWGEILARAVVAEASTNVIPAANATQAQIDTADTNLKTHLSTNWDAYTAAYVALVAIAPSQA